MPPLTDGHGVHRQVPLSALSARQRAILNVLRDHGPVAVNLVGAWLARDVPAFKDLPPASINHTLATLSEVGHAEATPRGWVTRTITAQKD